MIESRLRRPARNPVTFRIEGHPRPKGSMNKFMRQSSKGSKLWQNIVKMFAVRHFPAPIAGPVRVEVHFRFPIPKRSTLGYPGRHVGDVDKLIRNVLDGLTRVAYGDDSQVIAVAAFKDFGEPVGATVTVEALEPRWTSKGKCERRGA